MLDLVVWLVLSIVILVFFAGWIYGFHLITTTLGGMDMSILSTNPNETIGNISAQSFGVVDPLQTSGLHNLAFAMIFIMAMSIFLGNFMVKAHPAFFIVYLFIIIGCVIASVYISNQYETLLTNEVLGTTLQDFTAGSFIMLNLPLWTTIIGIFGAIFLFMGITRDEGLGGGVI